MQVEENTHLLISIFHRGQKSIGKNLLYTVQFERDTEEIDIAVYESPLYDSVRISTLNQLHNQCLLGNQCNLLNTFTVSKHEKKIRIRCSKEPSLQEPGIVLNRQRNKQVVYRQIQKNNILHFGEVNLRVDQVYYGHTKLLSGVYSKIYYNYETKQMGPSTNEQCRVCMTGEKNTEQSDSEYLVNPCNCKGSVSKIHLKCLIEWLNSRQANNTLQGLRCEICKVSMTTNYRIQGKELEIYNSIQPYGVNYVRLKGKFNGTQNHIYLSISFQGFAAIIGSHQGPYSVNLSDQSVSLSHAMIVLRYNRFLVRSIYQGEMFLDHPTILYPGISNFLEELSHFNPKIIVKLASHYLQFSIQ